MLTSLNAAANVGTKTTVNIRAEDAKIARIRVLFLRGLNLNRDFVLEWMLFTWISCANTMVINAMVCPNFSPASRNPIL